jgi:sugar-specific transcriptional regulator TrmB
MRDSEEGIISDLKRIGFTEYESRIYIQLLKESPATAYEIAKSTGVPRPNSYNALEALTQRNAVLRVSENPVRYIPAAPGDFLDGFARQTRNLCTQLGVELSDISQPAKSQYVWVITEEAAIHDKIDALIEQSQEIVMVKAADEVLRRHKLALKSAAERGVELLVILFGKDADEFRFNDRSNIYLHESNGVRMGTADNLFTVTSDHAEMITVSTIDVISAAHTRNRPIVNMAESLIRHDFYMSKIFETFGDQIDAAFGPYLRDLRMACFTPEQISSFKAKTRIG